MTTGLRLIKGISLSLIMTFAQSGLACLQSKKVEIAAKVLSRNSDHYDIDLTITTRVSSSANSGKDPSLLKSEVTIEKKRITGDAYLWFRLAQTQLKGSDSTFVVSSQEALRVVLGMSLTVDKILKNQYPAEAIKKLTSENSLQSFLISTADLVQRAKKFDEDISDLGFDNISRSYPVERSTWSFSDPDPISILEIFPQSFESEKLCFDATTTADFSEYYEVK